MLDIMKTKEKHIMKYENTYWNGKGKYEKEYHELFNRLVPLQGKADTEAGEVLRRISILYYDLYNNGSVQPHARNAMNFLIRRVAKFSGFIIDMNDEQIVDFLKSLPSNSRNFGRSQSYVDTLDLIVDAVILYVQSIVSEEE